MKVCSFGEDLITFFFVAVKLLVADNCILQVDKHSGCRLWYIVVSENGLTYSITSGNIGSAFEVVPDLGEVKVRCHLDYETGPRVSM